MKNFNIALILAAATFIALPLFPIHAENRPSDAYSVDAGKIILYSGETARVVTVGGVIDGHCRGQDGIYYILIKSENGAGVPYIGCVDPQTGEVRYEKKLTVNLNGFSLKKFMVAGGTAYILAEQGSSSGPGRTLNRINLNSMEADSLADVLDYHADAQDLVLLVKSGSVIALKRNEVSVPVNLAGEGLLRIGNVEDNRMVFVTNGEDTEIIDVVSGRGVYRYSGKRELAMPEGYNLVVEVEDAEGSEQNDREMIFYKVFIDGSEAGRTDSGPARLPREFHVKLDENKYHLVRLERWMLNAARGRYDRENNIRQPGSEHIFMPMNRIVKLSIKFDGKKYHFEIIPVYKQ